MQARRRRPAVGHTGERRGECNDDLRPLAACADVASVIGIAAGGDLPIWLSLGAPHRRVAVEARTGNALSLVGVVEVVLRMMRRF